MGEKVLFLYSVQIEPTSYIYVSFSKKSGIYITKAAFPTLKTVWENTKIWMKQFCKITGNENHYIVASISMFSFRTSSLDLFSRSFVHFNIYERDQTQGLLYARWALQLCPLVLKYVCFYHLALQLKIMYSFWKINKIWHKCQLFPMFLFNKLLASFLEALVLTFREQRKGRAR